MHFWPCNFLHSDLLQSEVPGCAHICGRLGTRESQHFSDAPSSLRVEPRHIPLIIGVVTAVGGWFRVKSPPAVRDHQARLTCNQRCLERHSHYVDFHREFKDSHIDYKRWNGAERNLSAETGGRVHMHAFQVRNHNDATGMSCQKRRHLLNEQVSHQNPLLCSRAPSEGTLHCATLA